jgi:two-component system C4-dicarboxylate transport sensor histidine kinase DctB
MASEDAPPPDSPIPDDALLLLNRATLVVHTVRSAVHELNNVLQMIGGSAEMLASADVPAAASARIEAILRQTGRGQAILQAVGDLARRDHPSAQATDVATIADRALQLRRYEHLRGGIAATLNQHAAGPMRARVDPQQLLQAILNLVVNAEEALTGVRNGAIQISLRSDDRHIDVTVSDNGPGIDGDLDLIAPFVTTRGSAAAGLGLAAARLIATQSGGNLEVVSGAEGARWTLRLPVATDALPGKGAS